MSSNLSPTGDSSLNFLREKLQNLQNVVDQTMKFIETNLFVGENILNITTKSTKFLNEKLKNLETKNAISSNTEIKKNNLNINKSIEADKIVKTGIAFPISISQNNIVGNFCSLFDDVANYHNNDNNNHNHNNSSSVNGLNKTKKNRTKENNNNKNSNSINNNNNAKNYVIGQGDLIKVEFGAHIDGHPIITCKTFVINPQQEKINDEKGDVLFALYSAIQCVMKKLKIGKKLEDYHLLVEDVANEFDCSVLNSVIRPLGHYQLYADNDDSNNSDHDDDVDNQHENENSNVFLQNNKLYSIDIALGSNDFNNNGCEPEESNIHEPRIFELSPEIREELKEKEKEKEKELQVISSQNKKQQQQHHQKKKKKKKNANDFGLKQDSAKTLFNNILNRVHGFPFSLLELELSEKFDYETNKHLLLTTQNSNKTIENPKLYRAQQKLGLRTCQSRDLLNFFQVWKIHDSGCVARYRCTIIFEDDKIHYLSENFNPNQVSPLIETKRRINNPKIMNILMNSNAKINDNYHSDHRKDNKSESKFEINTEHRKDDLSVPDEQVVKMNKVGEIGTHTESENQSDLKA